MLCAFGVSILLLSGLPMLDSAFGEELMKDAKLPPTKHPKMDSIVAGFVEASNKAEYASNNSLNYESGKLQVFILLQSTNYVEHLPAGLEIERVENNIVQARLTAQEIMVLSELEYVNQIRRPDYAVPLAEGIQMTDIEAIEQTNFDVREQRFSGYFYLLLIIPAGVGAALVWKFKQTKGKHIVPH